MLFSNFSHEPSAYCSKPVPSLLERQWNVRQERNRNPDFPNLCERNYPAITGLLEPSFVAVTNRPALQSALRSALTSLAALTATCRPIPAISVLVWASHRFRHTAETAGRWLQLQEHGYCGKPARGSD